MYVYPASWSFDRRLLFCQHVERRRIQTHGARRFFRMDDDSNKQFFLERGYDSHRPFCLHSSVRLWLRWSTP